MIDIKVPAVGESISEVTLVKWLKQEGAYVERDEVIAELESEKATFEVNAEQAGVLKPIGKEGDTLKIGDVVAQIDETAAKPAASPSAVARESVRSCSISLPIRDTPASSSARLLMAAPHRQRPQPKKPAMPRPRWLLLLPHLQHRLP